MRLRYTALLGVIVLFRFASLVSAAPADTAALVPNASSAEASPSCNPLLAALGIAADPNSPVDSSTLICGACSQTICQGKALGTLCTGGTNPTKCTWVYGDDCPVDAKPRCLCWSGPLP